MINTRTLQNFVITIVVFFGSFSLSAEAADSRNRAADFAASRTKPLTPGAIASLKALRERERLRTEQEAQSIQSRPLQMDSNGQVFKKDFTPELNTATTARSGALKSLSSNSIPRCQEFTNHGTKLILRIRRRSIPNHFRRIRLRK